eukprot:4258132-Prymnesium_polylepis.1
MGPVAPGVVVVVVGGGLAASPASPRRMCPSQRCCSRGRSRAPPPYGTRPTRSGPRTPRAPSACPSATRARCCGWGCSTTMAGEACTQARPTRAAHSRGRHSSAWPTACTTA